MTPQQRGELNDLLDKVCRFGISDRVSLAQDLTRWETEAKFPFPDRDRWFRRTVPAALVVIERMVQQCYGGFQVHYICSGLARTDTGEPINKQFVESMLVPFADVEALAVDLAQRGSKKDESA